MEFKGLSRVVTMGGEKVSVVVNWICKQMYCKNILKNVLLLLLLVIGGGQTTICSFSFFLFAFLLTTKFLECIWPGGNPADLRLSSCLSRVFPSFRLPRTRLLHSGTFYPQLYLFSLAHYFSCFLLLPAPLAPVHAPANFMEGQSLENTQGRWKQSDDSYLFSK